jgi:uncharacterized metal-binding protein
MNFQPNKTKKEMENTENNDKSSCLCDVSEYMVLACSGASYVGHLSDLVARKLRDDGTRKMNCLTIVGADIAPSIERFKKTNILFIDGCPTACGKKALDRHTFPEYNHVILTEMGYEKGKTVVNKELIEQITRRVETIY